MVARPPAAHARPLRKDATYAERRLWRALGEAMTDWKFRRQHPVGRVEADTKRTQFLEDRGWRAMRFWNNDVIENIEAVVMVIIDELENRQAARS
ncbi:MAG: DUF559 domain-containing protein [Alphaproteobacteria bacterium]